MEMISAIFDHMQSSYTYYVESTLKLRIKNCILRGKTPVYEELVREDERRDYSKEWFDKELEKQQIKAQSPLHLLNATIIENAPQIE